MSPGNRGPKDGTPDSRARPSKRDRQPDKAEAASQAYAPGPSTQTQPAKGPSSASRRRRPQAPEADKHDKAASKRAAQQSSGSRQATQSAEIAPAEDAWADYEEGANDWQLTDEHSIAGLERDAGSSSSQAQARTTGMHLATSAFDPQQHAVPRGPSYDPSVDLGSWQGLSGQDAQQSWPVTATMLTAGLIRLGRGVDNDVVLADPSISRAHAELRRRGEFWEIVDLQSGNGTFVAGQRITHSPFVPGAVLGLGSGTYRLMLPGTVAPADAAVRVGAGVGPELGPQNDAAVRAVLHPESKGPLDSPKDQASADLRRPVATHTKWLRYTLVALSCVTLFSVAAGSWHMLRVWDVVGPLHTAMFEHYLQGVEALNAHRWSQAQDAFHAVMQADPTSRRGKRYLAAALQGRLDEAKLAQAQAALAGRDWSKAWRLAQELQQSFFHTPSRIISQQIAAHVGDRIIQAQAALEAGETKLALDLLAEADGIMVERPDVALLKMRAESTLGLAGGSSPPPVGPVVRVVSRRGQKRQQLTSSDDLSGPLGPAINDFNEANIDEALAKLDAQSTDNAQSMGQSMRLFLKAYNTGLQEHRNKRAFAAIQALNQAKALEAKIGGGAGKLAGLIDVKLADMYYVLGMQAYAAMKFGEANEAFRQALEHVPEHALSKSKLDELEQKAQGKIDEAQSLRGQDTEKAKSLLRDALQMVAPNSVTAVRARRASSELH